MKPLLASLLVALSFSCTIAAEPAPEPEERFLPIGLTDEEKTRIHEIGQAHRSTRAPVTDVRNPAEWEPSQGVLVRWPLGIPVSLVAEMSEDVMVTTVVADEAARTAALSS